MKISCPACHALFALDDKRVPANGLSIKCPKCKSQFAVHAPKAGEEGKVVIGVTVASTGAFRLHNPDIPDGKAHTPPRTMMDQPALGGATRIETPAIGFAAQDEEDTANDTVVEMKALTGNQEADQGSEQ